MMPRRISISPSRASSDATRRSQASASSNPPPTAQPWTAAIVGFSTFASAPVVGMHARADARAARVDRAGPAARRDLLEVEAGREGAIACAADDDDADVGIRIDVLAGRDDLADHLPTEGVERLRPIERQVSDVVLDAIDDRL